ncbi:MAG: YraN family protein [Rhizobiaceae bacterium]
MTFSDERKAALRRGHRGEMLAAFALRLRGYRIVDRNFRNRLGEIDIVARKGDLIAFVEVKVRATHADAINAVGPKARHRIANAANSWIGRQPDADRLSWRFDIIAVTPRRWPRHFEDVF